MSKVLVTGVDGFTGVHLIRTLLDQGCEVHGLIRSRANPSLDPSVIVHRGDLQADAELVDLVRQIRPDKVVHLAAISFVGHGNIDEIYQTNLLGTRHLLEAIRESEELPSAILLASSANIYGNSHSGIIGEQTSPDPVNDYAVSKLAMEQMAKLYRNQLPIIVARPFNYTGVGQSINFLIPKIVSHVRRRAKYIELGNVDIERDWSDVRLVTDAYFRLIHNEAAIGGTFNICSGHARSLRDILDLTCRIVRHEMEVHVNQQFVRSNEVRSLCGSNAALISMIGPLKALSIEETLRWMLASDSCV